jgi:hypothetical protein
MKSAMIGSGMAVCAIALADAVHASVDSISPEASILVAFH